GVEETGACTLPLQGERQVHGRGRLAHATLARGHHDQVADTTQVRAHVTLLRVVAHGLYSQCPYKAGRRLRPLKRLPSPPLFANLVVCGVLPPSAPGPVGSRASCGTQFTAECRRSSRRTAQTP